MTEHFAVVGRKNSLLTGKVPITVSGRGVLCSKQLEGEGKEKQEKEEVRRGGKKLSVHHMKSWSIDILHCYSNFPLAKILQNISGVQKTLLQKEKEKTVFSSITKGWVQGHLIRNYKLYQKVKLWVDLKSREGVCFLTAGSTDKGRESWKFCLFSSLINFRNQKKACGLTAQKIWDYEVCEIWWGLIIHNFLSCRTSWMCSTLLFSTKHKFEFLLLVLV